MVEDAKDSATDSRLEDALRGKNWSQDTLDTVNDWYDARENVSKWDNATKSDIGVFDWMGNVVSGKGLTRKKQIEYEQKVARKDADKLRDKLELSMSKDDFERDQKTKKDGEDKDIPWVLIIIIAAIAIVLILLLRKKPVEETVESLPEPVEDKPIDLSSQRMSFDREKSCKRICGELGLDYDTELAQRDGDLVKLLDDLYTMKG